MHYKEISIRLETAFGKFMGTNKISSDEFCIHPTEAIERGLTYLSADNRIDNLTYLLEYCNFGDLSLEEICKDDHLVYILNDLIRIIKNIKI